MSDEQPEEEERTSLSALLNRRVPANPGKPRPWVPADSAGHAAPGDTGETDVSAAEIGAGSAAGPAMEPAAGGPQWPPASPAPAVPPAPPAGAASESGAAAPRDGGQSLGDLSALVADVRRVASQTQGRLTELRGAIESAEEQTYEATAADESVTITVTGRPRVTSVYVDPKAVRGGPEALGAWIVEAVNTATGKARAGAQGALLDGLDPQLRAAIAPELENLTATATSDDGAGAGAVRRRGDGHA
jgi:DNA-binding protein YbaB